jgi:hypothetical protein
MDGFGGKIGSANGNGFEAKEVEMIQALISEGKSSVSSPGMSL